MLFDWDPFGHASISNCVEVGLLQGSLVICIRDDGGPEFDERLRSDLHSALSLSGIPGHHTPVVCLVLIGRKMARGTQSSAQDLLENLAVSGFTSVPLQAAAALDSGLSLHSLEQRVDSLPLLTLGLAVGSLGVAATRLLASCSAVMGAEGCSFVLDSRLGTQESLPRIVHLNAFQALQAGFLQQILPTVALVKKLTGLLSLWSFCGRQQSFGAEDKVFFKSLCKGAQNVALPESSASQGSAGDELLPGYRPNVDSGALIQAPNPPPPLKPLPELKSKSSVAKPARLPRWLRGPPDLPAGVPVTTLMLSNLPPELMRGQLVDSFNAAGFAGHYDFLYLPQNGKQADSPNFGYCFVNFTSQENAIAFANAFKGFRFPGVEVSHPVFIRIANVQGLDRNLRSLGRCSAKKRARGLLPDENAAAASSGLQPDPNAEFFDPGRSNLAADAMPSAAGDLKVLMRMHF